MSKLLCRIKTKLLPKSYSGVYRGSCYRTEKIREVLGIKKAKYDKKDGSEHRWRQPSQN